MKPSDLPLGVLYDQPFDDYHASPAVSHHGLSDFARSPFHYHALHLNPQRPPEQDEAKYRAGRLAHCLVLEPEHFASRYAVGPVDDRRLAAWKAWEAKVPAGVETIKPSEHEIAQCQALALRSIPEVARLLDGPSEVSVFWHDPATDVYCRARPDKVHRLGNGRVILLDVKTCRSAKPDEFARQAASLGYHRQAAHYTDGYQAATGDEVLGVVFACVEGGWPFAACAVMFDDASIAAGRHDNAALLARFAECQRKDEWPGYVPSGVEIISLPRWAAQQPTENDE